MISRLPHRHSLVIVTTLTLAAAGLGAQAFAGHGVERIARARGEALGSTVTVRGTVSVPSDAFDLGFAIQDGHAGIYVLNSGGVARTLGAEVEVTGTLVESFGLLAIQPSAIAARGRGKQVKPHKLRTGSVGEATEGRLLKLHGLQVGDVVDDGPFGFIVHIDDGSGPIQLFLFPGTGISIDGLVDGASVDVVCFSSQFETHFECDPRSPADLEID
jgi:hypothetical protein